MSIKIQGKIVGYEVVKEEEEIAARKETEAETADRPSATIIRMTERVLRPEGMEALEGSTYKIKTPLDDHAMYVTINDIILNAGTEHEQRRPFEIFINSKNMDHFQWIVALTRLMSAVFRKGGDVTFLAEEKEELSEQQQLILDQKRAEAVASDKKRNAESEEDSSYPASATLCNKCHTKAVIIMDNCATCLSCGYSKCG